MLWVWQPLEPTTGIEPAFQEWESCVLPLHYIDRKHSGTGQSAPEQRKNCGVPYGRA